MEILAFVLFVALVTAWLVAPNGEPAEEPVSALALKPAEAAV